MMLSKETRFSYISAKRGYIQTHAATSVGFSMTMYRLLRQSLMASTACQATSWGQRVPQGLKILPRCTKPITVRPKYAHRRKQRASLPEPISHLLYFASVQHADTHFIITQHPSTTYHPSLIPNCNAQWSTLSTSACAPSKYASRSRRLQSSPRPRP